MTGNILNAVFFSMAPAIGMAGGGAVAAWCKPGNTVRSYIQHLAAGIVFAAVGVEILPDVMHRGHPFAVACGFAVGVVAMLAIRGLSRRAEASRESGPGTPWPLIGAVSVDIFVDGMLVGVGFAIGARQGILLTIALTGCAVSLGLATAVSVLRPGTTPCRALTITSAIAALPIAGAAVGALIATLLSGEWLTAVLAFTCAALLYLIAEELLVEAHESQEAKHESAFTTAVFFAGFLALLLIDMLLG
ncbi:MAG: ZIP family metal transporter [Nitrospirota bacterium]